jgi:plastocyanin
MVLAVVVASALQPVTSAASQQLVSIDIVDDRPIEEWGYSPGSRHVAVGTWVTWSNSGYEAHTVTAAVDGSFDSGILQPSEGFSWYFDQDGTYEYLCTLHEWMLGTVVVGSGIAPEPEVPSEESEVVSEE